MNLGKNYLVPLLAFLGLVFVLLALAISYFLFKQAKLSVTVRALTWEECVKDPRSVIMESYPARCSITGIGSVVQPLSDEQKKSLIPPMDTSCNLDSDCTLVVNNTWADCSLLNICQPIDYSLETWVAVNQERYAEAVQRCEITALACDPKPVNDRYSARCMGGFCQKTPLP